MRKRLIVLAVLLLAAGTIVLASGGGEDPLISGSYLEEQFTPALLEIVRQRAEADGQAIAGEVLEAAARTGALRNPYRSYAPQVEELISKERDLLACPTGTVVMPLSGSIAAEFSSGALIDLTEGAEIPSQTLLSPRHRYLVAEDTVAAFSVSSPAAVLQWQGYGALASSAATDYTELADALRALGLFQGSGTGYGKGYDLERYPTRLEALVMFIRVLGEEPEALAYQGEHPFSDIPWGDSYVAYAYSRGYTVGYGDGTFGSDDPVDAATYVEFLLRAMGYSSPQEDWLTALDRAVDCGLLTAGERSRLEAEPFCRAQVAYLSYYALDAVLPDGQTLARRLVNLGIFSDAQLEEARSLVSGRRIS